eukprot:NODE_16543_length_377_cov_15.148000_g16520_i0.p2 GENE.NODE_16543_length_377_cov_15.148000_g16520_i0~~NODE_16543_length_377_cov_15.148000_g16520_i0.p2  ORF type:complete len:116 (-),score=19.31 NODE_16543_length_377_cov_15.148000_g16520_i0:30-344(-)
MEADRTATTVHIHKMSPTKRTRVPPVNSEAHMQFPPQALSITGPQLAEPKWMHTLRTQPRFGYGLQLTESVSSPEALLQEAPPVLPSPVSPSVVRGADGSFRRL